MKKVLTAMLTGCITLTMLSACKGDDSSSTAKITSTIDSSSSIADTTSSEKTELNISAAASLTDVMTEIATMYKIKVWTNESLKKVHKRKW